MDIVHDMNLIRWEFTDNPIVRRNPDMDIFSFTLEDGSFPTNQVYKSIDEALAGKVKYHADAEAAVAREEARLAAVEAMRQKAIDDEKTKQENSHED